jgi:hypothetical protein
LIVATIEAASEHAAAVDAVRAPSTIYHYTDPKGLIGILSEGRLWATDIRYLNDRTELRHAERIHKQALGEIAMANPGGSLQQRLAEHPRSSASPVSKMVLTYVVCFSEYDDLLTQWKTYGSWGAAFSVGFDRARLGQMFNLPMTIGHLMMGLADPSKASPDVHLLRGRDRKMRNCVCGQRCVVSESL